MYTFAEYQEVATNKLAEKLGPATITLFLLHGREGAQQMANPATIVGLLDAAIILMQSNGLTEDEIKQAIRDKWDEVPVIIARTEKMQEKGKKRAEELMARMQQQKELTKLVGTEIPDSELPPAPELATAPVSGPASPADVSDVEWPKNES